MVKFFKFGIYNTNYKYIILSICCGLFNNTLSQINYYTAFESLRLFPTEEQAKYSSHNLIHQIFNYLGIFFFSIYFSKKNEIQLTQKEMDLFSKQQIRISENQSLHIKKEKYSEVSKQYLGLIVFLLVLFEQIIDKYNCILSHLDFWMIELIIISFLSSKILKKPIYKHQKFVLIFNLIPIIFKIVTIILSFKGVEDDKSTNQFLDNNGNLKLIYINYPILMPIGIILYSPLMTLKSYINVKMKYFMDTKYISEYELLKLYGLIGTIFYTIICIISTFFECKEDNDNKNIFDYVCGIIYKEKKYFENFISFVTTTKYVKEIFIEILVIFLGMISFCFYKFYSMMIIKFLTPVHITFLTPIYYFFFKVILIIYNLFYLIFHNGNGKFLDDSEMKYTKQKFFLDVSGDIICMIGFLIYLELIELNCFDLSYNSRSNIIERERKESSQKIENEFATLYNLVEDDNDEKFG
jgi:hypothetical protein